MKISVKYIFIAVVLLVVAMVWSSLSQPGIADLSGDFKEVAMYRNENNTGPVVRIYAVTVSDTVWTDMEAYGNYMPYSKLGTTTVYFFKAEQPTPDKIEPGAINFPASFNASCLGKYQKNSMGAVSLSKHPFQ